MLYLPKVHPQRGTCTRQEPYKASQPLQEQWQLWARCSNKWAYGEYFRCKSQSSLAAAVHGCDKRHKRLGVPTGMQTVVVPKGPPIPTKWANILSIHICCSSVTSIVSIGLFQLSSIWLLGTWLLCYWQGYVFWRSKGKPWVRPSSLILV